MTTARTGRIRLLLADDHRLLRESLRKLLAEDPAFEVVGEAADGRQALALAKKERPDIVLLDISMPELNGIDAIRSFLRDVPGIQVCVLSMHSADPYVLEAVRLGAKGYLVKNAAGEEVKAALRAIASGQSYFSPEISSVLAKYLQTPQGSLGSDVLSGREREVLQLIGEGKTLRDIGKLLSISVKTVKNHRDHIAQKLNCRTTAELVKHAIRFGLTPG